MQSYVNNMSCRKQNAPHVRPFTTSSAYNTYVKVHSNKLAYLQWFQDSGEPRLKLIWIVDYHFEQVLR